MFYQIQRENKVMITLVTLLLKMVAEVDLKILIFHHRFQIFLKIFLVILVNPVIEEEEEIQT